MTYDLWATFGLSITCNLKLLWSVCVHTYIHDSIIIIIPHLPLVYLNFLRCLRLWLMPGFHSLQVDISAGSSIPLKDLGATFPPAPGQSPSSPLLSHLAHIRYPFPSPVVELRGGGTSCNTHELAKIKATQFGFRRIQRRCSDSAVIWIVPTSIAKLTAREFARLNCFLNLIVRVHEHSNYIWQQRKPCCRKETARCRKCSFWLKFANNIPCKYKTSQASKATLQSSKHADA